MNKNFRAIKYIVLSSLCIFLFPNCAKKSLPPEIIYVNKSKDKKIRITAKKMNKLNRLPLDDRSFRTHEDKVMFEMDQNRKIFKKYQPIELNIENLSNNRYVLGTENIDLIITPIKKVVRRLVPSMFGNILTGASYGGCVGAIVAPDDKRRAATTSAGSLIGTGIGLTNWQNTKKQIIQGYEQMGLSPNETILIPPHNQVEKVIFVEKKNFKNKFYLMFLNLKNEEVVNFDINLENNIFKIDEL